MQDTLSNRIDFLSIGIDEVVTCLYQQNINEGIGKLGSILQDIEDILNQFNFLDHQTKKEFVDLSNSLFIKIVEDIENNDAIRLADTLRYELLENIRKYSNIK
ncbi:MAG: hypothetical protein K0R05_122 [Anaerocolumna sp.]|jgi:hypothetical protein|nr:hypothetical protein [Anaerocolumna sp.]